MTYSIETIYLEIRLQLRITTESIVILLNEVSKDRNGCSSKNQMKTFEYHFQEILEHFLASDFWAPEKNLLI